MPTRPRMRKRQVRAGRPPNPMPKAIPDTPENVAKAAMKGPPKKKWRYLLNRKVKQ